MNFNSINFLQLISALFLGLASGYLGSFMVLRRMALVGDALSHVALPGVALGLIFSFNPLKRPVFNLSKAPGLLPELPQPGSRLNR